MPICNVCDGESFYDQNGKFYCFNCGTQSQDMQVEVNQELDFDNMHQSGKLRVKNARKSGRKRKPHNIGKPWVVYEGFQFLLKAQVDSLIEMGFDEKLKDVIGQLWFYYLRNLGVAFCDDEKDSISLKARKITGRSKNLGTLPPSVQKKRRPKTVQVCKYEDDQEMVLKEEEFYEEDKPTFIVKDEVLDGELDIDDRLLDQARSSNSSESEAEKTPPPTGSCGSFNLKKNLHMKNCMSMTQPHTLCFCYLGLVYLQEPVLLNDLIRWVREGAVPYHKASVVLPPEMKFAGMDNTIFNKKCCPGVNAMYDLYQKLSKSLSLDMQYTNEACKIILASLVKDLEFSESIQRLAWYLFDILKLPSVTGECTLISVDAQIMAVVVIAVKLVYYLDGRKEFEDIMRTTLLRKLDLPNVEVWKKWIEKTMIKAKLKLHNGIPRCEEDLKYIHDLSVYTDYCTKDVFKSFEYRNTTTSYYTYQPPYRKAFNAIAKDQYYKTFSTIAESMDENLKLENIKRMSSSFPLSISHTGEIMEGYNLTIGENEKTEANVVVSEEIVNVDKKAQLERSNERVEKDLSEIQDRVKEKEVGHEHTNEENNNTKTLHGENDRTRDRYAGYVFYSDWSNRKEWHDSYKFLIKILSRRVELSEYDLQHGVKVVESKLFDEEIKNQYLQLSRTI